MLFERHTSALLLGLALTFSLAAHAAAQDPPDRANISVRIGATYRNGATQFGKTSGAKTVAVDQTASMTVRAAILPGGALMTSYGESSLGVVSGGIVAGGPGQPPPPPPGVQGGIRGGVTAGKPLPPAPTPAPPDYSWTLDARLVAITAATVKVEVRWTRTDAAGRHEGDARAIVLRADERHMIDFLGLEDKQIANLFVEVGASRVEDPRFAKAAIVYELWLVHETPDGHKITRPLRGCSGGTAAIAAHQGEAVTFDFDPILFPLGAGQPVDGSHGQVSMRVRGSVTGRLRSDNTIELIVRSERTVQPSAMGGVLGGVSGGMPGGAGGGEKVFVVRPDDTTSVQLPPPNGSIGFNAGAEMPSALRPGVDPLPSGNLAVSQAVFFAGSKTSLLIKLRAPNVVGGIVEKEEVR